MIPPSTSNFQDYVIDVTILIQDMIDDPSHSFGFGIRQKIEYPYRRMIFASRDNSNVAIHPKLIISYTELVDIETTNPNSLNVSVYSNPAYGDVVYLSRNINYKIYNIFGQIVSEAKNYDKINTSGFNRGIYIVVSDEGQKQKLIIN